MINYTVSANPIALAAGEFNGDGRLDVATANYGNGTVGLLLGNPTEPLREDLPGTGLRIGTGRGTSLTPMTGIIGVFRGWPGTGWWWRRRCRESGRKQFVF